MTKKTNAGSFRSKRIETGRTMAKIGERIYHKRRMAGLTQVGLGEKIGVSGQAVARWEAGLSEPKPRYINAICDVLDVSPSWLMCVTEDGGNLNRLPGKTTRSTEITVKGKRFGLETNGQELAIQFIGQSTTGWLRIDIADTSMTIYNGNCYLDTGAMLFGPIDNETSKQICGLIAPWIAPFVNQAMEA